jgi:hypothetical protein
MPITSSLPRPVGLRRLAPRWLPLAGLMLPLLTAAPARAADTVCGQEVKEYVAKVLASTDSAKLKSTEDALYKQFSYCAQDAQNVASTDTFFAAARQCGAKVSILGSLFYEEMSCCGYDPQRRQFACPVKIKQPFGFGGSPLPGSREYVLHCVADAAGVLQPVGDDSVHLSDSRHTPPWQFAVIAAAKDNLHLVQPMSGAPRQARSILSWQLPPRDCNYQPIWGNALDYTIRLDQ